MLPLRGETGEGIRPLFYPITAVSPTTRPRGETVDNSIDRRLLMITLRALRRFLPPATFTENLPLAPFSLLP